LLALEAEHDLLSDRLTRFGECRDALDVWRLLGVPDPSIVADLEASEMFVLKSLASGESV